MALKLGFPLVAPDAANHVGVTTVSEIWDNINNQWLSVTVAGGGGVTYTAGDGISITSGVISVKKAEYNVIGGIKCGYTSTEMYKQVNVDANGNAFATLSAATNAAKGIVKLSDSTTIATDIANNEDTKAVTPKAISAGVTAAVNTAVAAKIVEMTLAQYTALQTKDPNVLYAVTY